MYTDVLCDESHTFLIVWGSNFSILREGRVAEMKLLFTKLQEEITTVKKSVTQFRVEAGSDSRTAEFPVIELKPESPKIVHREVTRSPQASFEGSRPPLALRAKAGQVDDIVDIREVSNKSALNPVTYSATGALKAKPCSKNIDDEGPLKVDRDFRPDRVSVNYRTGELETVPLLDEKRAKYQYTTRKFIATQEMIEFHTSRAKSRSFELTI